MKSLPPISNTKDVLRKDLLVNGAIQVSHHQSPSESVFCHLHENRPSWPTMKTILGNEKHITAPSGANRDHDRCKRKKTIRN
jgi:hypothetical protein